MGCEIQVTDTGIECAVHKFDFHSAAFDYLAKARGYRYESMMACATDPHGIAFFRGPEPKQRASLRQKHRDDTRYWSVAFWEQ